MQTRKALINMNPKPIMIDTLNILQNTLLLWKLINLVKVIWINILSYLVKEVKCNNEIFFNNNEAILCKSALLLNDNVIF